jgi:hypothetical protein
MWTAGLSARCAPIIGHSIRTIFRPARCDRTTRPLSLWGSKSMALARRRRRSRTT